MYLYLVLSLTFGPVPAYVLAWRMRGLAGLLWGSAVGVFVYFGAYLAVYNARTRGGDLLDVFAEEDLVAVTPGFGTIGAILAAILGIWFRHGKDVRAGLCEPALRRYRLLGGIAVTLLSLVLAFLMLLQVLMMHQRFD